jgi:4'-phosphopantetheinyl transferase
MGAVDIWHVDFSVWAVDPPVCNLTDDETARASRLRGEDARGRWVRSRLALRAVLAAYSGEHASQLHFAYGPFGKPRLAPARGNQRGLHFNVTRSGDLCLIAVSRDRQLGIDIERINGEGGEDAIARQFFTAREAATIAALSGMPKTRAFLDIWTRKEAYTKAIGLGLQHPLSEFDVLPSEAGQACGEGPAGWRLIPLDLPAGFVGTLAAETPRSATALAPINITHLAFDPHSMPARAASPFTCDRLQERAL